MLKALAVSWPELVGIVTLDFFFAVAEIVDPLLIYIGG